MSQPLAEPLSPAAAPPAAHGFLRHAKVVGLLTLVSRVLGLVREVVSAHFLGTGLVASAFTVAFTIPNLFRKLFGEGALSAAFIPLYQKAIREKDGQIAVAQGVVGQSAADFAAASVNLLVALLLGITLVGEAIIIGLLFWPGLRSDYALTLRLSAIMLPYVVLICGAAFLSGILQVHRRFAAAAAAPILLNVCHVGVLLIGSAMLGIQVTGGITPGFAAQQTTLTYWLAGFVLVAGGLQLAALLPDLRAVGFRFRLAVGVWTPTTKTMLRLTIPVAMGAGIMQLSVLLDRGISTLLMQGIDPITHQPITTFTLFGQVIRYPMEAGAPARLAVAQFLYLFPLGIFATALATAIFPSLSGDALEKDRTRFRASLRQGIEASLWEGFPASVGLILVREPAIRLLFLHGQMTSRDADLIGQSLLYYAAAIWAFSMLQIISRAYYALHDMKTPLYLAGVNLVLNLVVEIPLLWWLGEAGMAVGTLVAFSVQSVGMLWLLDRKIGELNLRASLPALGKMLFATAIMAAACLAVRQLPFYPAGEGRMVWAMQLAIQISIGGGVYVAVCRWTGVAVMDQLLPQRFRKRVR